MFKVGDKVRVIRHIVDDLDTARHEAPWPPEGAEGVVKEILPAYSHTTYFEVEVEGYPGLDGSWPYAADEIEAV